jgi:hypothetical protein
MQACPTVGVYTTGASSLPPASYTHTHTEKNTGEWYDFGHWGVLLRRKLFFNGRRGSGILDVIDQDSVEQGLVPIVEISEIDVLPDGGFFEFEMAHDSLNLRVHFKHSRRQQSPNTETISLTVPGQGPDSECQ